MAVSTVLFDLDGTLLPMDKDVFVNKYFSTLAAYLAPHGYNSEKLIDTVWKGTGAMIENDGSSTNETKFWCAFADAFGEAALKDKPLFDYFYEHIFDEIQSVCGFDKRSAETVRMLKERGLRVGLATNPIFPKAATGIRIRWAGLDTSDFDIITTYENSSYCKPNLNYYIEVCQNMSVVPEECLMVGNDVVEDMVAEKLGMKVFLLTDYLINKPGTDIRRYQNGSFPELIKYASEII